MTRSLPILHFWARVMAMGKSTYSRNTYLEIDVSDAKRKMDMLSLALTKDEMVKLEERVIRRTAKRVKTIVAKEVPKKYHIKNSAVRKDIKRPQYGHSMGGIQCSIPIEGERHIIGGKTFTAAGGRHGWKGIVAGKRYKIKAQIIRGKASVLPETMGAGDNPPFRNFSAPRLNNAAFTRAKSAGFPPNNLPLTRVVGIATPQMPLNRSADDVQDEIGDYMDKRIDAEFNYIMKKCR